MEVPDDIREKAKDALSSVLALVAGKNAEAGAVVIAQALLSERLAQKERDAKIAENMPAQIYRDAGIGPAGRSCKPSSFDDAAAAIRNQSRVSDEAQAIERKQI